MKASHDMRFRTLSAAASLLILGGALTGCSVFNPGEPTSHEREISEVTAVDLETAGNVVVTKGDDVSLTITAGENVIDSLTSEVTDGVLELGTRNGSFSFFTNPGPITYELTVPSLDTATVSGSGDLTADFSGADAVELTISGSGDIDASGVDADTVEAVIEGSGNLRVSDIDAESVTARIEGSGDITLAGTAADQSLTIEGSGDLDASDVTATDAVALIEGTGSIAVHATATLAATIEGSGTIRHAGSATVEKNISGTGDIVRAD